MIQLILIICFASLHIAEVLGDHLPRIGLRPPFPTVILLGGMASLWLTVTATAVVAKRAMDRQGRAAAYLRAETVASSALIFGAVLQVVATFALGWLDVVRTWVGNQVFIDEFLALAPILVLMIGVWWAMAPLHRRIWEATLVRRLDEGQPVQSPPSRWQAVWSSVRNQALMILIPLTLLTAWSEAFPRLAEQLQLHRRIGADATDALQWIGVLSLITLAPFFIRSVWSTVRIGPGEVRDLVLRVCGKFRIRVNGPWLWRIPGRAVNGAILGIFYPFRYILFTDGLLESLSKAQLEAVVAHEVAHVRNRHLIWLGVCVIGSVTAVGWVFAVIIWLTHADARYTHFSIEGVGIIISLATAIFVFGWVSRRFEWQADAFAAKHMSQEQPEYARSHPDSPAALITHDPANVSDWSANVMIVTLQRVAQLNGVSPRKFSFRHGSIAERQRRLAGLVGRPLNKLPIDRQIRWLKRLAAVAFLSGFVTLLLPN